jgi:hypothetical protein
MFNFGTNITVAASSLVKNKTGPRVGSLGFMSGNYKLPFPKYINKGFSTLFIPQKIVFTNFGFETKPRIEEKIVIGILPIPPTDKSSDKEIDKLFTETCNNLHHQKWQKAVMNVYNWKCKPICLIIPNTNPEQLLNESNTMFIAWVKAVLKSSYMCNILDSVLSKNLSIFKKKFKLNPSIIEILLRMSANAEIFNNKIDALSKQHRREIIYTISWLNTLNIQHNIVTYMKEFKTALIPRNGQRFNRRRGIETVGKIIFSPLFYKLRIYAKTMKIKEVIEFMNTMDIVRAKSVNLLLQSK